MDLERNRKIHFRCTMAGVAILVALIVYMIVSAVVFHAVGPVYRVLAIVVLVVFWFITEILPFLLTKELEGLSADRKSAYYKYLALTFVSYAGIAYFMLNTEGNGIVGAMIYVAATMYKRRFQAIFTGRDQEGNETEAAQAAGSGDGDDAALTDGAQEAEAEGEAAESAGADGEEAEYKPRSAEDVISERSNIAKMQARLAAQDAAEDAAAAAQQTGDGAEE